jgi:hypothetical protein
MVNTFLPYPNFLKIAKVLDNKRLGKQRVEAKQILDIVTGEAKYTAWRNHPVVKQWMLYPDALKDYINVMIAEWIRRGFKNTMKTYKITKKYKMPWFVKSKVVNLSHQASLLRKEPTHYKKHFTDVPAQYMKYSYVWPSGLTEDQVDELIRSKNKILDIKPFAKLFDAKK